MHIYDRSLIHGRHITITGNTAPNRNRIGSDRRFLYPCGCRGQRILCSACRTGHCSKHAVNNVKATAAGKWCQNIVSSSPETMAKDSRTQGVGKDSLESIK
jgi:hypothetical protein